DSSRYRLLGRESRNLFFAIEKKPIHLHLCALLLFLAAPPRSTTAPSPFSIDGTRAASATVARADAAAHLDISGRAVMAAAAAAAAATTRRMVVASGYNAQAEAGGGYSAVAGASDAVPCRADVSSEPG
ncbi:unnamed protein product, partial [Urochloa humidicola]